MDKAQFKCEDPAGEFDCDDYFRYKEFYDKVCRKVKEHEGKRNENSQNQIFHFDGATMLQHQARQLINNIE